MPTFAGLYQPRKPLLITSHGHLLACLHTPAPPPSLPCLQQMQVIRFTLKGMPGHSAVTAKVEYKGLHIT